MTANRSNLFSLRKNSVTVNNSEYDSYVNLGFGELEEITKLKNQIKEKDSINLNKDDEIHRLNELLQKNYDEETELLSYYEGETANLTNQLNSLARFSFSVSNEVSSILFGMKDKTLETNDVSRVTDFLQKSINSLEAILSDHYKKEIRISLKHIKNDGLVKTLVRGKNNIKSRDEKNSEIHDQTEAIDENYAYSLIVKHGYPFFAEGDLLNMVNKRMQEDYFYCGYDSYFDLFISSIVVPIVLSNVDNSFENVVFGFACIDCNEVINEWSECDLEQRFGYLIIANYINNLTLLLEEYRNESN